MNLGQYLEKAEALKKEIADYDKLEKLYADKKKSSQEEYLTLMSVDLLLATETDKAADCEQYNKENQCCDCETPKVQALRERMEILEEAVDYHNLWRCKKCGHYSMPDFVCHNCGYDRTEPEGENG